jgi:hypothetical protein
MWRKHYQKKFRIIRPQQIEIPLTNEQQYQTSGTQEIPPPTYDQTVQGPAIIGTRI